MAPHPLRSAHLLMAVAAAVATAGSALLVAPARAIPTPLSAAALAVASDASSAPASTPQPWFGMNVTSGSIGLWKPPAMPAGAPAIAAKAGILVDMDDGEILWERRPHVALPPASLTKVLTSLVALENFSPGQEVTVTRGALSRSVPLFWASARTTALTSNSPIDPVMAARFPAAWPRLFAPGRVGGASVPTVLSSMMMLLDRWLFRKVSASVRLTAVPLVGAAVR